MAYSEYNELTNDQFSVVALMGQHTWTTPSQHKWLMGHMGDFLRAQDQSKSTRSVETFNNTIRTLFLSEWTEEKEREERKTIIDAAKLAAEAAEETAAAGEGKRKGATSKKKKKKLPEMPSAFASKDEWVTERCKVSV